MRVKIISYDIKLIQTYPFENKYKHTQIEYDCFYSFK